MIAIWRYNDTCMCRKAHTGRRLWVKQRPVGAEFKQFEVNILKRFLISENSSIPSTERSHYK
jgi:hypothetical protein